MAFCSAVTLCFASIFSLVAAALLAISFSTDNWRVITINRDAIKQSATQDILDKFDTSPLYFTRTRGLFRECFPGEKTNAPIDGVIVDLYMSPVETWCHNLNYYIPDDAQETKDFKEENMARIHMGRSMIALFIAGFFCMFIAFTTGVVGCWKTAPGHIVSSAIMMLLACLLSAGAMGLYHGVEHYEKLKINESSDVELFKSSWSKLLTDNFETRYDWSYIVAWVGVGMCLGSSILFSMSALCIKSDKEREEAMNMQYLMPVYPQKGQPYGPYGAYAYPQAAFPQAAYPQAGYPMASYGSQQGLHYSQY